MFLLIRVNLQHHLHAVISQQRPPQGLIPLRNSHQREGKEEVSPGRFNPLALDLLGTIMNVSFVSSENS